MREEPASVARTVLWFIAWMIFILVLLLVFHFAHAEARDLDGRYAQSPLREWFNTLKSGRGLC